jgi:predicted nuclease of predicted toxin-antitoxin system
VKLLLDENLSDRIIFRIGDLFPGSMHVKTVGLSDADDDVVWEWAKQHGFTIASKDTDFHQGLLCLATRQRSFGCGSGIARPT